MVFVAGLTPARAVIPGWDTYQVVDDPDVPEEDDSLGGGDPAAEEGIPVRRAAPVGRFPALDAFSSIQRQLAAIDFTSVRAAQRGFDQSAAFRIREVVTVQDLVAKHFAQSIDFSRLTAAFKVITDTSAITNIFAAQTKWADSLVKAIHFPALEGALASSAAFATFMESNAALLESVKGQADTFARIAAAVDLKLPRFDTTNWLEALGRWIPGNLRHVVDLDAVATLTLDEGIPLSWVPRTEIVSALVDAESAEDRHTILDQRRDDILDDCETALASITNEWAEQCRAAISAMRLDLDGPAQSHASNIIDSVVLALHGNGGRDNAKARAQEDFDDLPLQLAAENLTLRPLFRAFTAWWPNSGVTPPDHFARHPTAHAVGYAGVFAPRSALVAVMLATSLTVQYSPGDGDDGTDDVDTPT